MPSLPLHLLHCPPPFNVLPPPHPQPFLKASWGYNTAQERQDAAAMPGVRVIGLEGFLELLKFGIVMNVSP